MSRLTMAPYLLGVVPAIASGAELNYINLFQGREAKEADKASRLISIISIQIKAVSGKMQKPPRSYTGISGYRPKKVISTLE